MKRETESAGVSARMQQAIEDQIAALTENLVACLATARAAGSKQEDGAGSSDERTDAVKMAEASATLLQALARAKGGIRFEYHVKRDAPESKPKVRLGWNGDPTELLSETELDALDDYERADYCAWTNGSPPVYGVWRKDTYKRPATVDQLEELREDLRKVARRVPYPLENRGSNSDAGQSAKDA
ncbi:MAG TPA: hypothetical protein VFV07_13445 [Rhizomicrobium sp.]|nr:hypothetical protein [Rhizomicrobium sp.]